jgi:FHA domain-containing protein
MDAAPLTHPLTRAFDGAGGTIGRDDTNDFALPDKHRRVSRLHATISFPGGLATITNSSTSLPIAVGEHQVESGESMPLTSGVLVEIGPYVLKAVVPATSERSAPSVADGPPLQLSPSAPQRAEADTPVHADLPRAAVSPTVRPVLRAESSAGEQRQIAPDLDIAPLVAPTYSQTPESARPPAHFPSATTADPFADLLSGIGAAPIAREAAPAGASASMGVNVDPLALLGSGETGLSRSLSAMPPTDLRAMPPDLNRAGGALIPDDFNPFEMPSDTARNSADPLANLLGTSPGGGHPPDFGAGAPVPSIDTLFQSGTAAGQVHAPLDMMARNAEPDAALGGLLRADSSTDPFALFGNANDDAAAVSRPMRDNSMEVASAFLPPAPLREATSLPVPPPPTPTAASPDNLLNPASAAVPMPAAGQAAASASSDALTEAFLRGAGLAPGALPHGLTPEIMTIVGSLLRSATAGAVDMLAARAATKREVQASVTIISVQANNPLKFLPNADAALLQLLGKKMPGFMRADVAMRDAFEDLRAHEVGVIAGTRAALTEVLGKFDPAVLGDKLARGSVLESLVPSARKAKLWDMYLERYLQIRREAEDDFQSIFGRAFVQAYERETARIKGDAPTSGEGRA